MQILHVLVISFPTLQKIISNFDISKESKCYYVELIFKRNATKHPNKAPAKTWSWR